MGGVANFVGNVVGGVGDAVGDVVGGAADVVGDVVGGVGDAVGDVVEGVGDVADDVFDTVSDVVEDAWDNDIVRTAALAAGAYYGGAYFFPETTAAVKAAVTNPFTATATNTVGGTVYTSLGPAAAEIATGGGLLTTATAATAAAASKSLLDMGLDIGKNVAMNVGTNMAMGALAGGGGGGGQGFVPQRLSRGASTMYGNFGAKAANLGINADVADGMMKVANSNLAELQQFRRDVNRTATLGPTIGLGSTQLGGIGVRSTTRGVS
jgi:hypothetical protein